MKIVSHTSLHAKHTHSTQMLIISISLEKLENNNKHNTIQNCLLFILISLVFLDGIIQNEIVLGTNESYTLQGVEIFSSTCICDVGTFRQRFLHQKLKLLVCHVMPPLTQSNRSTLLVYLDDDDDDVACPMLTIYGSTKFALYEK